MLEIYMKYFSQFKPKIMYFKFLYLNEKTQKIAQT